MSENNLELRKVGVAKMDSTEKMIKICFFREDGEFDRNFYVFKSDFEAYLDGYRGNLTVYGLFPKREEKTDKEELPLLTRGFE